MKRNVFPCNSEKHVVKDVLSAVIRAKSAADEECVGRSYEGRDHFFACSQCSVEWSVVDEDISHQFLCDVRSVLLDTLCHGTL